MNEDGRGLLAATVTENITPGHGPRQSLSIVKVPGTDRVGVGVTIVGGVTIGVGVTTPNPFFPS